MPLGAKNYEPTTNQDKRNFLLGITEKDTYPLLLAYEIYNALENGNNNISSVLDHIEDEKIQGHLTEIMAEDYGITDNKKAIEDLLSKYELEKLESERDRLIEELNHEENIENKRSIGKKLNDIVLILSKINQTGYKKFE